MTKRPCSEHPPIRDYGSEPFVFNIRHATTKNQHFRTTLWTGKHLQLTVMCVPVSGDIGAEVHPDTDQFIRIEQGHTKVYTGTCRNTMCEKAILSDGDAVLIPAGTWHNIVNVGDDALKLYSLYAPPHHPFGTVHKCKSDALCEMPTANRR